MVAAGSAAADVAVAVAAGTVDRPLTLIAPAALGLAPALAAGVEEAGALDVTVEDAVAAAETVETPLTLTAGFEA